MAGTGGGAGNEGAGLVGSDFCQAHAPQGTPLTWAPTAAGGGARRPDRKLGAQSLPLSLPPIII